jgi:hypothetical protein
MFGGRTLLTDIVCLTYNTMEVYNWQTQLTSDWWSHYYIAKKRFRALVTLHRIPDLVAYYSK